MSDRNLGLEILTGIKEIKAHKEGKVVLVTRVLRRLSHPQKKSRRD